MNKVIAREYIENKLKDLQNQYKVALENNAVNGFKLKCQIEIIQEILGKGA